LECGSPLPLSAGDRISAHSKSARGLAQSKTWRRFVALFALAGLLLASASAQNYSIDWSKIAGGGGTSTGGVYSVSGTIGQPDAGGPLTNGQYSVTGGFWALPLAVQTTNAPTLQITAAAPGFATVSWSPSTPGFTLQASESLLPASWVTVPGATNPPVIVPATLPAKFYRLFKTTL
jgi:hypothetical protein